MARGKDSGAPHTFSCTCGALQGHISDEGARAGIRLGCYCRDCRAAKLYFGQPDPAPGPVDLFETTPDAIVLTQGNQHLGLFRLSPRGAMRWYATCCNTLMFNSLTKPRLAFAGVQADRLSDPDRLGPITAQVFIPQPGGKSKHKGATKMAWGIARNMLAAQLSGSWRQTPFFDIETSEPVAKALIPSKEERAALYPSQRRTNG